MIHRLLRLGVKQFASGSMVSVCRKCALLVTSLLKATQASVWYNAEIDSPSVSGFVIAPDEPVNAICGEFGLRYWLAAVFSAES